MLQATIISPFREFLRSFKLKIVFCAMKYFYPHLLISNVTQKLKTDIFFVTFYWVEIYLCSTTFFGSSFFLYEYDKNDSTTTIDTPPKCQHMFQLLSVVPFFDSISLHVEKSKHMRFNWYLRVVWWLKKMYRSDKEMNFNLLNDVLLWLENFNEPNYKHCTSCKIRMGCAWRTFRYLRNAS